MRLPISSLRGLKPFPMKWLQETWDHTEAKLASEQQQKLLGVDNLNLDTLGTLDLNLDDAKGGIWSCFQGETLVACVFRTARIDTF